MTDYEKLYHKTFNAITDAERLIEQAAILLRATQQVCETLCVKSMEVPHTIAVDKPGVTVVGVDPTAKRPTKILCRAAESVRVGYMLPKGSI